MEFFVSHPLTAFLSLGAVVLVFTGSEALYADMGHFGRRAISRAWFLVAFPALMLNYLGQASLILRAPDAVSNPFYLLLPEWSRVPMIVLATAATLIASQAVISGAFSVTRQVVQLGFLPRMAIKHTSPETIGQIYLPAVNWTLFVLVVGLCLGFGSSGKLATAYGIAVTGTLLIDSILFLTVARVRWRRPRSLIAVGVVGFVFLDLLFLGANLPKIAEGGWFPLLVGASVLLLLTTWDRGRQLVAAERVRAEGALPEFIAEMHRKDPADAHQGHRGVPEPGKGNDAPGPSDRADPTPRNSRGGRDPDRRDYERPLRAGGRAGDPGRARRSAGRLLPPDAAVRLSRRPRRA